MRRFFEKYYYPLLHVILWTVYVFSAYSVQSAFLPPAKVVQRILIIGSINALTVYTNLLVLIPRFFLTQRYRTYLGSLLLLMVIIVIVRANVDHQLAFTGFYRHLTLFSPQHYLQIFFTLLLILVISSSIKLLDEWLKKSQLETELRNYKLEAELRWLKAQTNPHFLFNTLNNLYTLVYLKSDRAAPVLLKLSQMLRYMLYECNAPRVPMVDEILYLQNCIDLQQIKTDRIQNITFVIENHAPDLLIEPMLFINFLENSFKHSNLEKPGGWVKIKLCVEQERVDFCIENSLNLFSKRKPLSLGQADRKPVAGQKPGVAMPGALELKTCANA